MNYGRIKLSTLEVFRKCGIEYFPIECEQILNIYGIRVKKYSEQKQKRKEKCLKCSEDAFTVDNVAYYNDEKPITRIRFSLAHEIGHAVLDLQDCNQKEREKECDCFASYLLAPRMAIHYAKCKNQNDVAKIFIISQEAAQIAFDDYKHWYRRVTYHKMDAFDKAMYNHFYNKEQKCFVYSTRQCAYCGTEIYNSSDILCKKCSRSVYRSSFITETPRDDFTIAEEQWLYRGL